MFSSDDVLSSDPIDCDRSGSLLRSVDVCSAVDSSAVVESKNTFFTAGLVSTEWTLSGSISMFVVTCWVLIAGLAGIIG
jgi:hypothetical protein